MPMTSSAKKLNSLYRVAFSQNRNSNDPFVRVPEILSPRNRSPVTTSAASVNNQTDVRPTKSTSTSSKITLFKVFWRTIILVLLYYTSSIGLTFYQKWLLKKFHYPLSIVITHLVVKFLLSALCRIVWEAWTRLKRPILPWHPYTIQLAPTGVAAALDIGLSNWSFEFITVSLYTMSKSTAIIFIMGFALLFKLERRHWTLLAVVVMISGGLIMFTYQATQFSLVGFLMVISASFLSGLRWTLSQMVMQHSESGLANPIDMMYHIQPWMIVTLLPFAIAFEGLSLASTVDVFRASEMNNVTTVLCQVLVGAVMAFFMELTEYLLVSYTSSLTLSVSGIVKEVVTLTLAIVVTHDELSLINAIGLIICLGGISLHVVLKAIRIHKETKHSSNHSGAANTGRIRRKRAGEEELLMEPLNSDSEELDSTSYEVK